MHAFWEETSNIRFLQGIDCAKPFWQFRKTVSLIAHLFVCVSNILEGSIIAGMFTEDDDENGEKNGPHLPHRLMSESREAFPLIAESVFPKTSG